MSLVANWWVVADAAERAHGPVIGRGFFYVYKTVVWLVYLPIFMGFMITAFSKVHAQMKEDHHGMGRQRGVVVELPPGEDEDPDGAGRTFVVWCRRTSRTALRHRSVGDQAARQLAQQSSQVEELEAEGEAMAAQLAEQKSTIVRMGTAAARALAGRPERPAGHLARRGSVHQRPHGVEWQEAAAGLGAGWCGGHPGSAGSSGVLGPRGWRRVALSTQTSILRRVPHRGRCLDLLPVAEGAASRR